jgi:hypothetical protein
MSPEIMHVDSIITPPPGVTSNFDNPVSRENEIYIASGVFLPLMTGFLILRVYTRMKFSRQLGADDCEFQSGIYDR